MRISKEVREYIQKFEYPLSKEELVMRLQTADGVTEEERAALNKLPSREFRSAKETLEEAEKIA